MTLRRFGEFSRGFHETNRSLVKRCVACSKSISGRLEAERNQSTSENRGWVAFTFWTKCPRFLVSQYKRFLSISAFTTWEACDSAFCLHSFASLRHFWKRCVFRGDQA